VREGVAWAIARDVPATGVLVSDPAFAGSDTLATARALEAALRHVGPFDLILTGRNSVDADTGQVGPELAELLGLPFATGARELAIVDGIAHVKSEHDDGWVELHVTLPAVISTAERLCDPCKVDPDGRAAVDTALLTTLTAADLGAGPWGTAGSPTWVGDTRVHPVQRDEARRADESIDAQIAFAVERLVARGALHADHATTASEAVATSVTPTNPAAVVVLVEPDRDRVTRELLGAAADLAARSQREVIAIGSTDEDLATLGGWGADRYRWVRAPGGLALDAEDDVAHAIATTLDAAAPWAVLAPSTAWGREVASRIAARLDAGLTGDAIELEIDGNGDLLAWKPAFGGQLVAAIGTTSATQLATVRAGMLALLQPRTADAVLEEVIVERRARVDVRSRTRDDDLDVLADATVILGVGAGVAPNEYADLEGLRTVLGAELGATRKVTDKGWLPRARQIGITGRSVSPRLFISIGAGGKFNHSVGFRGADTVLAINPDPDAKVFGFADVGIVGDWHEVVPKLTVAIDAARS
jgi:electron transfer flavoprotein alpha subunit